MLLPEPPALSDFVPSDNTLLDWLRPRIDDSMLDDIARADDGTRNKKHFRELRIIRNSGVLPSPLLSEPTDVLQIISWSEPEDPEWKPGSIGERGQLMRAFCCAVLLQAVAEHEWSHDFAGQHVTIIQLTASVLALGGEPAEAALDFLWNRSIALAEGNKDRPFFALAILLLGASKYELDSDEQIRQQAEWVMIEEAEARRRELHRFAKSHPSWLLGLQHYRVKDETWRRLAKEILLDLPRENEETAAILRDIGRRIVEGSAYNEIIQ